MRVVLNCDIDNSIVDLIKSTILGLEKDLHTKLFQGGVIILKGNCEYSGMTTRTNKHNYDFSEWDVKPVLMLDMNAFNEFSIYSLAFKHSKSFEEKLVKTICHEAIHSIIIKKFKYNFKDIDVEPTEPKDNTKIEYKRRYELQLGEKNGSVQKGSEEFMTYINNWFVDNYIRNDKNNEWAFNNISQYSVEGGVDEFLAECYLARRTYIPRLTQDIEDKLDEVINYCCA